MDYEYHRLRAWLGILEDVVKEYPTSSIPNTIRQIRDRINHKESKKD